MEIWGRINLEFWVLLLLLHFNFCHWIYNMIGLSYMDFLFLHIYLLNYLIYLHSWEFVQKAASFQSFQSDYLAVS